MRANVMRDAVGFDRRALMAAEILRMQDAGILSEGESFELTEGAIVPMQPVTRVHELIESALIIGVARALLDNLWLGVETTIHLSAFDFMEPDFVVCPRGHDFEAVKGADIPLTI